MKNSIITISMLLLVSFSSLANNGEVWNNTGKDKTFKVGDEVTIKAGSKSAEYVLSGKIEHVCNDNWVKIDGFFIKVSDVEVIVKYKNVK